MANIAFKRGLAANLPSNAADGVFYLTTDSHRLYVGQGTSLVELNRYILEVADTSALPTAPHEGDFVWVKSGNMLLVCTDPANTTSLSRWTQINSPDTNDTIQVSSISTPTVSSSADGGITVSFNLNQTKTDIKGTATQLAAIPVSFTISAEDLATANEVAVDLDVASLDGGAKITTGGAGADSEGGYLGLKPGTNVTMNVSGSDVTFNAKDTTYTLTATSNQVTLTNDIGTKQELTLADDDVVTLTSTGNTITAGHALYNPAKSTSSATDKAPSHGGKFKVIDGISTNASGHITGYTEKEITLPEDINTTNSSATISTGTDGSLKMSVTDSEGKTINATAAAPDGATGPLFYTVNGNKVYNQGNIEFYTKSQIDNKFYDVNAMVFKGSIGDTSEGADIASLPISGVQRGWTYKVHTAGSYGGHSCDVGDLLIATGTETAGVITSDLTWSYIPSGDDTDSKFNLSVSNNKISLTNTTVGTEAGDVTIASANNLIGVSTDAGKKTITLTHKAFSAPTKGTDTSVSPAHGGSFRVLDSITTDNGHITGYVEKVVTLPVDNNTTYTIGAKNNVITLDGSTGADTAVTFAGGNDISITTGASNNTITVAHEAFSTSGSTATAVSPAHGGSFTVLDSITTDNGHVTGYAVKTVNLPADNNATYSLSGITTTSITGGAKATVNLTGAGGGASTSATLDITSSSLKVAAGTKKMTIDLEWGTF